MSGIRSFREDTTDRILMIAFSDSPLDGGEERGPFIRHNDYEEELLLCRPGRLTAMLPDDVDVK